MEGSTCQNDAISMVHCNQLSFEKRSVSYVTNMFALIVLSL